MGINNDSVDTNMERHGVDWCGFSESLQLEGTGALPFFHRRVVIATSYRAPGLGLFPSGDRAYRRSGVSYGDSVAANLGKFVFGDVPSHLWCTESIHVPDARVLEDKKVSYTPVNDGGFIKTYKYYNKLAGTAKYDHGVPEFVNAESTTKNVYLVDVFRYGACITDGALSNDKKVKMEVEETDFLKGRGKVKLKPEGSLFHDDTHGFVVLQDDSKVMSVTSSLRLSWRLNAYEPRVVIM